MAEKVCNTPYNVLSVHNRVACLYRVSTTKQVDLDDQNQADIPMQRKACREYAEKMGWTIVIEEQENGVSGFKVSANDRDRLKLLKEYAEQGKFDILLVFMFDRIGRRDEETPFVVEWFVKHGIQVWSVNEGEQRIDSHADRLMKITKSVPCPKTHPGSPYCRAMFSVHTAASGRKVRLPCGRKQHDALSVSQ